MARNKTQQNNQNQTDWERKFTQRPVAIEILQGLVYSLRNLLGTVLMNSAYEQ